MPEESSLRLLAMAKETQIIQIAGHAKSQA
jgi:hypothetical protein